MTAFTCRGLSPDNTKKSRPVFKLIDHNRCTNSNIETFTPSSPNKLKYFVFEYKKWYYYYYPYNKKDNNIGFILISLVILLILLSMVAYIYLTREGSHMFLKLKKGTTGK